MSFINQIVLYFAIAGIFTKLFLSFQEAYIDLHLDDGDDPKKYYQQGNAVMQDAVYVTNPESLYAGFSLEVGKQKQKVPFDPVTDRLGNVKQIPGLPQRDILYPIKDDANFLEDKLPFPNSKNSSTDMFPL